jgi:hypothetical protein
MIINRKSINKEALGNFKELSKDGHMGGGPNLMKTQK